MEFFVVFDLGLVAGWFTAIVEAQRKKESLEQSGSRSVSIESTQDPAVRQRLYGWLREKLEQSEQ